jgi:hypothetical protein
MTRRRQRATRLRLLAGLLVVLALPLTQVLWLSLSHALVHGIDHQALHDHGHAHSGHTHAQTSEHARSEEATLEVLLHGHSHGEGTVPHDHDTLPDGHRWVAVPLTADATPAADRLVDGPTGPAPETPPVVALTTPLRYLHCSLLI